MTVILWICAIASIGLLAYLIAALLFPEHFS